MSKVMKLIDPSSGLMECIVCGHRHFANLQSGSERADGVTRYRRGSWQCVNGCKPNSKTQRPAQIVHAKRVELRKSVPSRTGSLKPPTTKRGR